MVSANNSINNTVGASISGVTNTLTVTNPSNTASSQATANITVGGGTAGDAWSQHTISGTRSYAHGIDNSDSDKFKINTAAGSAVDPSSGTNLWNMTSGGIRLMPLQPAFFAYVSATIPNVTGDNTTYTIIFDTELVDRQANYNNATGVFTAPATGIYYLSTTVSFSGITAAHDSSLVKYTINGATDITGQFGGAFKQSDAVGQLSYSGNVTIPLTAGDTITVSTAFAGGAKVVDVSGSAIFYSSFFSGCLLF